jgi:hypothetical protein
MKTMNRLFLALMFPFLLLAQNTSSSLSGAVRDSAGAVVPNAKVTLTGQQNGFVRTTSTNTAFLLPNSALPARYVQLGARITF